MPFDRQPHLIGELVELRPMARDDFDALYDVARDPLIWEQHPVRDRCDEDVFRAFFEDGLAAGGALVAIDRKDNAVIGSSQYRGYNLAAREIEIGWTFLARSHWGGTYNGDMKRLMLRHAFRFVDCVVLLIGPDNIRSQRAAEKIGTVRDGVRHDSGGRESVVYRIRASDFH